MNDRFARIQAAFNGLDRDHMHLLAGFYAAGVVFEDPLGRIDGLVALERYYAGMYRNVTHVHFDFTGDVAQGDTHVVVWTMTLEAKGLNHGRPVVLDGNSILRFDEEDKVCYQRDYFDMAAMVYEHIPLLRFFIQQIKKRLAHA
jgi:hypothetical protein